MTLVQTEPKKIYMWVEQGPYTPTSNTIAYFPFIENADDYSGNNYVLSSSGTQETLGRRFKTTVNYTTTPSKAGYIGYWVYFYSLGTSGTNQIFCGSLPGYSNYQTRASANSNSIIAFYNSSYSSYSYSVGASTGNRFHVAISCPTSGGVYCYINGVKHTVTTNSVYYSGETSTFINSASNTIDVKLSDVIVENTSWTNQQVSDYFNATKSTYGIS